jgi:hypothetical protein
MTANKAINRARTRAKENELATVLIALYLLRTLYDEHGSIIFSSKHNRFFEEYKVPEYYGKSYDSNFQLRLAAAFPFAPARFTPG